MGLFRRLSRRLGEVTGTNLVEDKTGITAPDVGASESAARLRDGDYRGFFADPTGGFGDEIQENEKFQKFRDPFSILPTADDPGVEGEFDSIDELIAARTPEALALLRSGAGQAIELNELARLAATQPLEQFAGLGAFNEQQALLGTQGDAAQSLAIGNIPVSQFDQELQRRQRQTQIRGANARGERGGGASLLAAQQLRGGQQADIIAQRLQQLAPLADISRGVRSTLSAADESAFAGQAQIQQGLGTQEASIRLGTTAPLVQAGIDQAELSGLRNIARTQQQNQLAGQLANIAGRFIPAGKPPPPPPAPEVIQPTFSEAGAIRVT